jgi:nucleotide-binding universal stress UspA family protein
MKIHNILLAMDFSPSSEAALQYAAVVAKRYDARLFVVHVISDSIYTDVPQEILPEAKTRTIADAE